MRPLDTSYMPTWNFDYGLVAGTLDKPPILLWHDREPALNEGKTTKTVEFNVFISAIELF